MILYIEDNLSNLTLVERILDRYPAVELIPAMQATIGLELAREHHPDLIVLDLHLPTCPAPKSSSALKQTSHPRDPVVVLTADASTSQSEHVKHLGAADYLTKPLDVPNSWKSRRQSRRTAPTRAVTPQAHAAGRMTAPSDRMTSLVGRGSY